MADLFLDLLPPSQPANRGTGVLGRVMSDRLYIPETDSPGAIKRVLNDSGWVDGDVIAAGDLRQGKEPTVVSMLTGRAVIEALRPRRAKALPRHFVLVAGRNARARRRRAGAGLSAEQRPLQRRALRAPRRLRPHSSNTEGDGPMHTLTTIKTGLVIALLATVVAWLILADGALGAGGGNAANAKLCQKGGWTKLMDSSAHQFTTEDACISYAAHDGAVYALATLHVEPCKDQPYDGICVNPTGSGLMPGSVATETLSKNGSAVREDFPIVQGDGTIDSSPIAHFEIPCVAGNEYSASATGTSADSLTSPKAPGIPVSSNTAERASACP